MNDILNSPFMVEFTNVIDRMYLLGWAETNGGNVSYLLEEEEVLKYLDPNSLTRTLDITSDVSALSGAYLLITASGKLFRKVKGDPESNCGIIQINPDGHSATIVWGFLNDARPTSELEAHLNSHIERLKVDSSHRVVLHTHATNLVAMTLVHSLDEEAFTKTLWRMCSECIVVFPDGVGILPWMVPGTQTIGKRTAEKVQDARLVIWPMHGVFGTGSSMDEAFGLVETAEKAATIYMKIAGLPIKQAITDEELSSIAKEFNVKPKFKLTSV